MTLDIKGSVSGSLSPVLGLTARPRHLVESSPFAGLLCQSVHFPENRPQKFRSVQLQIACEAEPEVPRENFKDRSNIL